MSIRIWRTSWIGSGLVLVVLLSLAGCQSCTSPDDGPDPEPGITPALVEEDRSPLAARFMRYAYEGALLRSNHPLRDSLSAITSTRFGGRSVTVIDTFEVTSVQVASDSQHTVTVRAPNAITIQSVSWETSAPVADREFTLRIKNNRISEAPRVVGWPAFQEHVRDVAPDKAESILDRVRSHMSSPETGA